MLRSQLQARELKTKIVSALLPKFHNFDLRLVSESPEWMPHATMGPQVRFLGGYTATRSEDAYGACQPANQPLVHYARTDLRE